MNKTKKLSGGRGRKDAAYKHKKGIGSHSLSSKEEKEYRKQLDLKEKLRILEEKLKKEREKYKKRMSGGRGRSFAAYKNPNTKTKP